MTQVMFDCPKTGRPVGTGVPEDLLTSCGATTFPCHPDCPDGEHHGSTLDFYVADASNVM